jgi:hypothetical protein
MGENAFNSCNRSAFLRCYHSFNTFSDNNAGYTPAFRRFNLDFVCLAHGEFSSRKKNCLKQFWILHSIQDFSEVKSSRSLRSLGIRRKKELAFLNHLFEIVFKKINHLFEIVFKKRDYVIFRFSKNQIFLNKIGRLGLDSSSNAVICKFKRYSPSSISLPMYASSVIVL